MSAGIVWDTIWQGRIRRFCLLVIVIALRIVSPGLADESPATRLPPDDAPAMLFDEMELELFWRTPRKSGAVETIFRAATGRRWIAQGPAPMQNGQVEQIVPDQEVIGAIHTVAAHPTHPDILYIGAVNGGIWRTMNATAARPIWTPLTADMVSPSIGALEFDPADPNRLLAGIGRFSSFARAGSFLTGLLLTTDGGDTWMPIDDARLINENISGVAVRGDLLLASANDRLVEVGGGAGGLFRSLDGGATWSTVSGTNGLPAGGIFDLVGDPSAPNRFYASVASDGIYCSDDGGATWRNISSSDISVKGLNETIQLEGNNNTEMAVGSNGRLYVAVMINGQTQYLGFSDDQGVTWTAMDLPLTIDDLPVPIAMAANTTPIVVTSVAEHGLSTGARVRITGVRGNTAANGDFVITTVDGVAFSLNGSAGNGAYAGGGEWVELNGLNPRVKPGGQGSIHFSIRVDPANPNVVYVGGDRQGGDIFNPNGNFIGAHNFTGRLFRGDTTIVATGAVPSPQWAHLTHRNDIAAIPAGGTASGSAPHADSREMVFDAGGDIIEVDDGGIYRRTQPQDNMGDWFSLNGNLQVTEFHDIAYDAMSHVIIGGAQDNGMSVQTTPGSLTWLQLFPADGGDVAVDDTSQPGISTRYISVQHLGGFSRVDFDQNNIFIALTQLPLMVIGGGAALEPQFLTPIELNRINPARLVIVGLNSIYESFDRGDTIAEIGPGLGPNDTSAVQDAIAYGGRRNGIANADVLYVGVGMTVFVRTAVNAPLAPTTAPFPGTFLRDIVMDPDDWMTVYVVDSGAVFVTNDAGMSWREVTGNLLTEIGTPDLPVQIKSAAFVPGNPDAVFIGTHRGVFQMLVTDEGNWQLFGTGLPNVPVWALDYDATDNVLVAGTMGRGAWLISDVSAVDDDDGSCGDTSLGQSPCVSMALGNGMAGTAFGDVYTFNGNAGDTVVISVDTADRGDGRSNLDPIALLVDASGAVVRRGDDEVVCTFPPVCGFACPRIDVSLPADGTYTVLIADSNDEVCTGGEYAATADGSGGLILTADDQGLAQANGGTAVNVKFEIAK
jgi:hypothetical protein